VFLNTINNQFVVYWIATLHEHTVTIFKVEGTSENLLSWSWRQYFSPKCW